MLSRMSGHLEAMAGPVAGATWELGAREMTLGRSEFSDIVVPDEGVSGRHCVIRKEGAAFVIEDAGSRNGTFVNAKAIRHHVLRDGDRFAAGGSLFVFRAEGVPTSQVTIELTDAG